MQILISPLASFNYTKNNRQMPVIFLTTYSKCSDISSIVNAVVSFGNPLYIMFKKL